MAGQTDLRHNLTLYVHTKGDFGPQYHSSFLDSDLDGAFAEFEKACESFGMVWLRYHDRTMIHYRSPLPTKDINPSVD